ncbi:MAG: hypothetical protein JRI68_07395 [Deltaproteobacteria bacterium]|nr:hypothetical protein [Deltaproteobacteria bacterium]
MARPRAVVLASALLLAVAGCDGGRAGPAAAGSASASAAPSGSLSTSPPPARFAVAVDEKPVAIRSILAHSQGGRALHLSFSTHELGCPDLRQRGTLLEPDETTFDLTLAERLAPDGKRAWAVTRARLGTIARQGNLGEASVSADDPNQTVTATVKLALTNPASRPGSPTPRSLQLAGEIAAVGCGLMTPFQTSDARFQKELTVDVAGARFPIHGATLIKTPAGSVLRLSSEPHTCKAGPVGTDLAIALTLNEEGEAVTRVELSGYLLPGTLRSAGDDSGIAARFSQPPDGGTAVEVQLSGTTKIRAYPMELNGTARPRPCPPAGR